MCSSDLDGREESLRRLCRAQGVGELLVHQELGELGQHLQMLHNDLAERKSAIDNEMNGYVSELAQYNQRVSSFNQRAANGDFPSQQSFQRERTELQQQLADLKRRRELLNGQVDRYNTDVKRLQQLGVKIEELQNSLDSAKEAG